MLRRPILARENRWAVATTAVLVALTYAPLVVGSFGCSDDYLVMYLARSDPRALANLDLTNGRPLAIAVHLAFSRLPDIASMRYVRLLTIAGIAAVAVAFFLYFRGLGWSRLRAWATAVMLGCLPCWQVVAAWSNLVAVPFAALLAFSAARLVLRGGPKKVVAASALLVVALLTFQPAAMAFWPAIAAAIFTRRVDLRGLAARVVLAMGSAMIAAYVVLKVGVAVTAATGPRTQITESPLGKAIWFVGKAIPRALDPLSLRPLPLLAALVAAVLMARLWAIDRRYPVLAGGLIVASYVPNLVVAEDRPSARTMIGLMPVVVVLVAVALKDLPLRRLFPTLHARLPIAALCIPALAVGIAAHNTSAYFSRPQEQELALTEHAVRALGPVRNFSVRPSEFFHTLAPTVSYDEYGLPSSAMPYDAGPFAALAYRDTFGWLPTVRVISEQAPRPKGPFIDFNTMLTRAQAASAAHG